MTIRLLLADDQALVRGALAALLALEADLEVVAEVGRGDEVLDAVRESRPDVALLDVEMPGVDGIAAAAALRDAGVPTRVLIVTTFGRPGYVRRALEAGAAGFVVKDTPAEGLAEAVRRVHAGLRVVDPALAVDSMVSGRSPLTAREAMCCVKRGWAVPSRTSHGCCTCRRGRSAITCRRRSARRVRAHGPRPPASPSTAAGFDRLVREKGASTMDLSELGLEVVDQDFGPKTTAGDLRGVEFEACTFTGIVFDDAALRRAAFRDCRFEDCSLAGLDWTDASLNGCTFVGCRIVGTSFSLLAPSVVLDPCRFERTRLHLCGFAGRDMSRWEFTDCGLLECDLDESDLRHVVMRDCDLAGSSFRSCDMRDADLSGSRNLALDVRDNKVRGLKVDADAAASLLAPLGVILT